MVNLLVAMFADTYTGVKESADYEAQAARYRKIFELRRRSAIVVLGGAILYRIYRKLFELWMYYLSC